MQFRVTICCIFLVLGSCLGISETAAGPVSVQPAVADTLPAPQVIEGSFKLIQPSFPELRVHKMWPLNAKGPATKIREQKRSYDSLFSLPKTVYIKGYAIRFQRYSQINGERSITDVRADTSGITAFKADVGEDEESTFSTVFGSPEVKLQVNGKASVNVGASISKTDNPGIVQSQRRQVDPIFKQNLQLNVDGRIGDKLSIRTNWNTDRAFDFMNRVSVVYDGYDDEILQRLEIGNVFMQTGNSLIRGGNALFGLKGKLQLGDLSITSVLSKHEGDSQTQVITGGAQEKDISIRPADYKYDQYFFLDFYTRQEYERNVSDPQHLGQAFQLIEINVWVLRETTESMEGERRVIALGGLGVNKEADGSYSLPNMEYDPFAESTLKTYRDPALSVSADDFGVEATSFVEGYFVPLQQGSDYKVNRNLGYIALKRDLNARQAMAISFKYKDPRTGRTISVGDVNSGGDNRIYLKLIRPKTLASDNSLWPLMMKNVYALGVKDLTSENLELDIKYSEQNVSSSSLPGRRTTLLQDLGLDRVDQQGAARPDNRIDFSTSVLNPSTGTIIFPYLQPFGSRIQALLRESGASDEQVEALSFYELYEHRKQRTSQYAKNNFYLLEGQAKGAVSNSYDLGFSLVEGSVKVYANGRQLQEGTDYIVDYSVGSITILNERYLRRDQEIKIEYENNDLVQVAQKNFTGLRAEYELTDDIHIGSTLFKYKEKPVQDKIRIGNEPVNNTMLGFDAGAHFDAPWLTEMLDRLPLLQADKPSAISLSAEFAQLFPGVSHSPAVKEAISEGRLSGDEEQGLSFIDDFEGSDIGIKFMAPSRWHLAAAPAILPGYPPDKPLFSSESFGEPPNSIADKIARSDLRSTFAWYTIPKNIDRILNGVQWTPESQPVKVTDVFLNRDVVREENFIRTLDFHYDPTNRGPYNYNRELKYLLDNEPERTWGGMTTTLPPGQEDLSQHNVSFLEFWVQPVLPDGRRPTPQDIRDYDGKMYLDVGVISEDVIPNFKTNTEDGIARSQHLRADNGANEPRSYIPSSPVAPEGQFSKDTRKIEDIGLDGAPSNNGTDGQDERELFSNFIEAMRSQYGVSDDRFKVIREDPSNDDYVYYGEKKMAGLPLHKRFWRMYGFHEGNSSGNGKDKHAVTNKPDGEGLITPSSPEQHNAYFEYEIDWNPATVDKEKVGAEGSFIVDKVDGARQQDRWYLVRVPLKEWTRKIGDIDDFHNISHIRFWLSGYKKPFTMRFSSFELVGSQWHRAEDVERQQGASAAKLSVSTVNIEENGQRRPIPYRQPEGAIRAINRDRQRRTVENEQSIALHIQNLSPGELKMVKRIYPGGLDMVNYSHLRMYVHGEGYNNRREATLVIRFGTDLINNYYEYSQPIKPSDPNYPYQRGPLSELSPAQREREAYEVWLYEENSIKLLLQVFNELKQLRNQESDNFMHRYVRSDLLKQAPAGAEIAIKGNPSLDRVGEIGMGIKNAYNPQSDKQEQSRLNGEFWFNELRVSGFDNQNGWAANVDMQVQLSDFASLNAHIMRETDGFGALNSGLGQRNQAQSFIYHISSTFHMDKFLPARYGWNIPVTLSMQRTKSTPRYLPRQGDVRIRDFRNAVNARTDLTENQKKEEITDKVHESQRASERYSLNITNLTKSNSSSAWEKYTLDKTTLDFVYNTTNRRNPRYKQQDNWNYSGMLSYNLNLKQSHFFKPLKILEDVPVLHLIAGLNIGYMPTSVSSSIGINRDYTQQRRRMADSLRAENLLQSHRFSYNTIFGFAYDLTPALHMSFQKESVFDLSEAGINRMDGTIAEQDSSRYSVRSSLNVLNDLVFDSLSARRSHYREQYSASWQPNLSKVKATDWLEYSASYKGGYRWKNSPFGSGLGAVVSNDFNLTQSLRLDFDDILERIPWYQRLTEGKNGDEKVADDSSDQKGRIHTIVRNGLQALLSIEHLDLSLDISQSAMQSGYAGGASFFNMLNRGQNHFSPPFSFRTGLNGRIGRSRLVDPLTKRRAHLPSSRNLTDGLNATARFRPMENLMIDLTWSTRWNKTYTQTISIDSDASTSFVQTQSGKISSSVWPFGRGYDSLFKRQIKTALDDINTENNILSDSTGNGDGRSVLGKKALQEDFRKAYLGIGTGSFGELGFTPFPLPGWRIHWSGFEALLPFWKDQITSITIKHSYTGLYRLGWVYNADQSAMPDITLGKYSVSNHRLKYEPTTINLERIFSPVIGLDVLWDSNLRMNVQYDSAKIISLALSNTTIIEHLSKALRFDFSYAIDNFSLPLIPRIKSTLDFTLSGSYIEDTEQKYKLNTDLSNALTGPITSEVQSYDYSDIFRGGQSRVNASLIIGYQFSETVRANFEYAFNRIIPKSSGTYARTDHDIMFNIVVSLRSK